MSLTLTEALQQIVREADDRIAYARNLLTERLKERDEKIAKLQKQVETNYAACERLNAIGIECSPSTYIPEYLEVDVEDVRQLKDVRKALGCTLRATGSKSLVKGKKRVWVLVRCEEYPGLTIRYQQKLRDDAKCKIKRVRHTSYSRQLVCEA